MEPQKPFKVCPMCSTQWESRDDFLADSSLKLNGYKADFEELDWGLFYFTHKREHCYSTMTLEAKNFLGLYSGEKYSERRTGKEECPEFCLDESQLDRCEVHCECAFNREILQIIKEKQGAQT